MIIEIVPTNFVRRLKHCPPGLFLFNDMLCLKTDYNEFFLCSGDAFWGGTKTAEERDNLLVIPVAVDIREVNE